MFYLFSINHLTHIFTIYLPLLFQKHSVNIQLFFALFREASETYHVPNDTLVIKKGQKVMIPTFSLHNNPKYFKDPELFDSERFSPEEKAKRPSGVYFSFGDGPRKCIGLLIFI